MDQKQIEKYRDYFNKNHDQILKDFYTFLSFPSISADPLHKKDLMDCCSWLAKMYEKAGFFVEVWKTSVNPVIFAEHRAFSKNRPTLLLYHHYDVQPVDPIELWNNPPFQPTLKEGEIIARGAADNKGQCYYTLVALRAFLELGQKQDLNIKVIVDGEEETGSNGLFEILEEKKEKLQSDYTLIVDLGIPSLNQPAVTIGFRGIVTFDIECICSQSDLHSGQFGGISYNPLRGLVEVLSKIWSKEGEIQIPHFYDHIETIDQQDLMNVDLTPIIKKFNITALHHEKGYSQLESAWIRPTCEINGLSGGYAGAGFKTVIPAKANCKLSCRLVAGQDPGKIQRNLTEFLKKNIAKGLQLKIELDHGAKAYIASSKTPFAKMVKNAYEVATEKKAGYILAGGTLPIANSLCEVSGGETLGMGYGLDDDFIHAPNEHFGIDRLKLGMVTLCALLERLVEES